MEAEINSAIVGNSLSLFTDAIDGSILPFEVWWALDRSCGARDQGSS